jgi:thiol-disulfide isomerase/thioredoxin
MPGPAGLRHGPAASRRDRGCRVKTRTVLIAAAVAVVAAVGFVFTTSLKPPENGDQGLRSLSSVSGLVVSARDGKKIDLSTLRGKIVLIHFWATWCPPCVEEIPELQRFWSHYRENPRLALYSVSVDDSWEAIDKFRKQSPFDFPTYRDPGSSTAHRFGTTKFPETYIADGNGRILYHLPQAIDWDAPEVAQNIDAMLRKN